jgi:hypothetical protein
VLDGRTSVVNGINQQGRPFSGFEELCAPAAPIEDLDPDAVINPAAARETDELLTTREIAGLFCAFGVLS